MKFEEDMGKTQEGPKDWGKDIEEKEKKRLELRNKIKKAKDFDSLIKIVAESDGIQGSRQFFSGEKLADLITDVKDGRKETDHITSSEGLRDKVESFLKGRTNNFPAAKMSNVKGKSFEEINSSLGINESGENIDESELSKKLEQVETFEDLTDILLETKDIIPSTLGKLSGTDVLKLIDKFKKGEVSYKGIPRARGIQKAFERLLANNQRNLIEKLDRVKSFDGLYKVINDGNGYVLRDMLYNEGKVRELVDNIKSGDEMTLSLYRNAPLVNKIMDLLKKENKGKK